MTGSSIGMQEQDRSEREKFENELKTILKASTDKGILMRVIGSLAFQMARFLWPTPGGSAPLTGAFEGGAK